ncbi:MAG: hypothetical protein R3F37_18700 [Candidatus Competibacteraceae bacterium]
MIPVGQALENTGATTLLATGLAVIAGDLPNWAILTILMVYAMSLSDVINNRYRRDHGAYRSRSGKCFATSCRSFFNDGRGGQFLHLHDPIGRNPMRWLWDPAGCWFRRLLADGTAARYSCGADRYSVDHAILVVIGNGPFQNKTNQRCLSLSSCQACFVNNHTATPRIVMPTL